jgi:hypothetical protein
MDYRFYNRRSFDNTEDGNYQSPSPSLEEQIQNIMDTIIQGYTANPLNNNRSNMAPSAPPTLNDLYLRLIDTLRETMNGYNQNIYLFLQLFQALRNDMGLNGEQTNNIRTETIHNRPATESTPTMAPTSTTPSIPQRISSRNSVQNMRRRPPISFSNTNSVRTRPNRPNTSNSNLASNPLFTAIQTIFSDTLQDVVIRPTEEQINRATRNFPFNREINRSYTECPITLEPFEEGQNIIEIQHCGHCFSERAFRNWLSNHVRCPVCRYDIRDYIDPNDISDRTTRTNNQSTRDVRPLRDTQVNSILDSLTYSFTNLINHNTTRDGSYNILYTFEIPFEYYDSEIETDSSNNYMENVD